MKPWTLALSGGIALAASLAAWSFIAESPAAAVRRARIAQEMPQAERDRLVRRYETLRALPRSERDSLRRLEAAVSSDADLGATFAKYESLAASLPLYERQTLRESADPEQRAEKAVAFAVAAAAPKRSPRRGDRPPELPTLAPADFDGLMNALARAFLPPAEVASLAAQDPPEARHLAIARNALELLESRRGSGEQGTDEKIADILSSVPEPDRERLQNVSPQFRRGALTFLFLRNLVAEWQRIAKEQIPADEIREALVKLPPQEQAELARRPADDWTARAVARGFAGAEGEAGRIAQGLADSLQLRDSIVDRFRGRSNGGPGFPPSRPGHREGEGRGSNGFGSGGRDEGRPDRRPPGGFGRGPRPDDAAPPDEPPPR